MLSRAARNWTRKHLTRTLQTLCQPGGARWAEFEHLYILEIVRVQHEVKGLVDKAMEVEETLSQLEEKVGIDKDQSAEYQFHHGAFVGCVSPLNVFRQRDQKDLSWCRPKSCPKSRQNLKSAEILVGARTLLGAPGIVLGARTLLRAPILLVTRSY